jgi:hypothetical protein
LCDKNCGGSLAGGPAAWRLIRRLQLRKVAYEAKHVKNIGTIKFAPSE